MTMTSPAKALLQLTRFAQKRSKIETACCYDLKIATVVSAFSLATRKQELIFPVLGNTWENLKSGKGHLESCGLRWQGAGLSEKHPLGVLADTLASDKVTKQESMVSKMLCPCRMRPLSVC